MEVTMSIPPLTMVYMFITFALSFILPIVVWIILSARIKGMLSAIIVGALGFVVPQIVIRLNILQLLQLSPTYLEFANNNVTLFSFLLGFSAALFETVGRVMVFYFMRNRLSYIYGMGAGLGHGGIEAIYIVGLTYINNLIFSLMINTQGVSGVAASLNNDTTIQGIVDSILATPSSHFLVAGVERLSVMVIHVALSLIICYGFVANKLPICIALVLFLHTTLDTVSVLMSYNGLSIIAIELFVIAFAIASLVTIVMIKKHFPLQEIPKDEGQLAVDQGY